MPATLAASMLRHACEPITFYARRPRKIGSSESRANHARPLRPCQMHNGTNHSATCIIGQINNGRRPSVAFRASQHASSNENAAASQTETIKTDATWSDAESETSMGPSSVTGDTLLDLLNEEYT